jgi:integrase
MSTAKRYRLTDAVMRKLTLPDGKSQDTVWDTEVAGFGGRVTAGTKSFIFNFRVKGSGRERRPTIGRFPSWSASSARAKAKELRRLVDNGFDPVGDLEDERQAPTVADLIDRFIAEHLPKKTARTAHSYTLILERHVRPALQHIKVADVGFADIDRLHSKVSKTAPYMANRMLAVMSKMFGLAVRWQMRTDNPAKGIERNNELKRQRYLSNDEMAALTGALAAHEDEHRQSVDIIRMLLLTGARCGEIFSMRWDDIDLEEGIWSKPAHSTKQAKPHTVPLSAPAKLLLAEIAGKQKPPGIFVFPSDSKTGHVVEIRLPWKAICETANIVGLRVHDLRHSFASQLASAGASLPLIGALLGHSNPATTARYSHLFQDPQRQAVERVAAIIGAAGKPTKEPVVLPAKGGHHGRP